MPAGCYTALVINTYGMSNKYYVNTHYRGSGFLLIVKNGVILTKKRKPEGKRSRHRPVVSATLSK
jgi:hypothetical protein